MPTIPTPPGVRKDIQVFIQQSGLPSALGQLFFGQDMEPLPPQSGPSGGNVLFQGLPIVFHACFGITTLRRGRNLLALAFYL